MAQLHPVTDREQIAILDFGSQYSHLIARRVRGKHSYTIDSDYKIIVLQNCMCFVNSIRVSFMPMSCAPIVFEELFYPVDRIQCTTKEHPMSIRVCGK